MAGIAGIGISAAGSGLILAREIIIKYHKHS
jgi:hypothetical protein